MDEVDNVKRNEFVTTRDTVPFCMVAMVTVTRPPLRCLFSER